MINTLIETINNNPNFNEDINKHDQLIANSCYIESMIESNIPQSYRHLELTNDHQDLINKIAGQKFNKLYLFNNKVGTGKTTIATSLLRRYIAKRLTFEYSRSCEEEKDRFKNNYWLPDPITDCYFINIRDYLYKKKRSMSDFDMRSSVDFIEDKMMNSKILVMDEIGAIGSLSDYDTNLLYIVCDERNNKNVITIFTSNYDPETLANNIGASLARRILEDALFVEVR